MQRIRTIHLAPTSTFKVNRTISSEYKAILPNFREKLDYLHFSKSSCNALRSFQVELVLSMSYHRCHFYFLSINRWSLYEKIRSIIS